MTDRWIPTDWTFESEAVASHFDRHVSETLPWYGLATNGAAHLARAYLPRGGIVYDIGASTGNLGRALAPTIEARDARLIAIEASAEMAALYNAPGELVVADALEVEYEPFDVAVLFLVLMFIPVNLRAAYLVRLLRRVRPGGAIIVVDKFDAPAGYLGSTIHRWTMAQKRLGGIPDSEITEKELSLSGAQRPLPNLFLDELRFERWLQIGEFRGYVFTKAETPLTVD